MSSGMRGSIYYIIDRMPKGDLVAAEIGVADTLNVSSWVAAGSPSISFKEMVLVDLTTDADHISCIHRFVRDNPVARFMHCPSVEAAEKLSDEYFDFVYIDGDHSTKGVSEDLRAWQNKVKRGGFICGHDYAYYRMTSGKYHEDPEFVVNVAVNRFAKEKGAEVIKMHTEFVIKRTW